MAYEDFTTYTEVDSGGDITITANKVTITTMQRVEDSGVYDDKGADHFGDYDVLYQSNCISGGNLGFYLGLSFFNDTDYTAQDQNDASSGERVMIYKNPALQIRLNDVGAGNADTYAGVLNTEYYYRMVRNGTDLRLYIYDDALRTNLVDTLVIVCLETLFQYVGVAGSRDAAGTDDITATIENLDLQETTPTTTDNNIPNYFNAKYITHH